MRLQLSVWLREQILGMLLERLIRCDPAREISWMAIPRVRSQILNAQLPWEYTFATQACGIPVD
jgi:hypothetical protein